MQKSLRPEFARRALSFGARFEVSIKVSQVASSAFLELSKKHELRLQLLLMSTATSV